MPPLDPTPGLPTAQPMSHPMSLAISLAPGVTRVLAPNPSPMTYRGTNSYLLGHDRITVIDPGPASDAHLSALIQAIGGRPVDQIIVTHSHLDHSPLSTPLAAHCGAPVLAFGDHRAGQSAVMQTLAARDGLDGGEGIDTAFCPTECVTDGQVIACDLGPLTVHHTPGHLGNHICLQLGDALFSGDHIMGWSSSLISPPDGDLGDFMASCAKVAALPCRTYYPGHGEPVPDAQTRVQTLVAHRQSREREILTALTHPMTPHDIAVAVYTALAPALLPAATRNVLAHLIDLTNRGIVEPQGALTATAHFTRNTVTSSPQNFSQSPPRRPRNPLL